MREEQIELTLPIPPSVNECYTWYPKRRKSDVYKKWINLCTYSLVTRTKYNIVWNDWLEAELVFNIPLYYKNWNKKKQDLDNFLKPTFDLLSKEIPWFKDEHIKKITTEKVDSDDKNVNIIIREIKWAPQTI